VSAAHALAILAAGVAAGTINTVVGSGTLITFPVLLALGYPPIVANVSNTIGIAPGSVTGALGYRSELRGQRRRAIVLARVSAIGAVCGAALLLILPASAFKEIVPAFIALALVAIIAQPKIDAVLSARRHGGDKRPGPWMLLAVGLSGVYGGYFGAAQGIMLIAILSLALDEDLQRVNALKVVLAGLVNLVAGVIFALLANVAWAAAGLIAIGAMFGGVIGARWGRRLPPDALRGVVVLVGAIAIVRLL
jgi:uncharacterized membrane protein YfcA